MRKSIMCKCQRQFYPQFNWEDFRGGIHSFNLDFEIFGLPAANQLKPSVILNMSSTELKEGLTAEEIAKDQPETPVKVQMYQMTDSRCKTCSNRNVSIANKFSTGLRERYEATSALDTVSESAPRGFNSPDEGKNNLGNSSSVKQGSPNHPLF